MAACPRKPCAVEGCARDAVSRGWCHGHYQRWVRLGDVQPDRPLGRQVNFACGVEDCPRDAYARQLCRIHYRRWQRTGDPQPDLPVRDRSLDGFVNHGYRYVRVPPDVRYLTEGASTCAEHRLVMAIALGRPLTADESVHHRDGDRLNNSLENLELWTRWQPSGQRIEDRLDAAKALLERYAPELLVEGPGPESRPEN